MNVLKQHEIELDGARGTKLTGCERRMGFLRLRLVDTSTTNPGRTEANDRFELITRFGWYHDDYCLVAATGIKSEADRNYEQTLQQLQAGNYRMNIPEDGLGTFALTGS